MKILTVLALFLLPVISFAQETIEIRTFNKTIPFLSGNLTTEAFIQALYTGAISIAAILVVIRFIWAGTEYMLSDLLTTKRDAKLKMQNALIGLVIILGAVTILQTINPQLLNLDVVGKGTAVNLSSSTPLSFFDSGAGHFRPGDEYNHFQLLAHCGYNSDCQNNYYSNLVKSCKENGGTRVEKHLTGIGPRCEGNIFTGSCSYYYYTCSE